MRACRDFFRLEYGVIDIDEVLDYLCEGIQGKQSDRSHIRDMVFGDIYFQGHHEPFDDHLKNKMFRFLLSLRSDILRMLLHGGVISHRSHFRYCSEFTSGLSLTFEVI